MDLIKYQVIFLLVITYLVSNSSCENKYSKEANQKHEKPKVQQQINFKTMEKPFRMHKINLLWSKAQIRLAEPKLKSLYSELKLHDKEEVTYKRMKSEGGDKDGLKEAQLRKKLMEIMDMYGLMEHYDDEVVKKKIYHKSFNEATDDHINKSLFKDKKLNKLWEKAETAGFSAAELSALREEFTHHQDKIDEYYSILSEVKQGPSDQDNVENSIDYKLNRFNEIQAEEQETQQKDYLDKVNLLRDQHRNLRDGFDRLHRLSSKGPNSKEFVEPKVQGLWKMALEADFTVDELESLKVELMHYENRLLKLRHLHTEEALHEERHKEKMKMAGGKTDGMLLLQDNIKKHARKLEKMHFDLETKIMQKHIEL